MAAGSGTVHYATRRFVLLVGLVTVLATVGAIVAYTAYTEADKHNQLVKACERTNVLRRSVDEFLKAARDAREDEGKYETAQSYQDIIDRLEGVEHAFENSAQVDCNAAFTT